MKNLIHLSGIIAAAALVTGCSPSRTVGLEHQYDFGNAVRQNIVAQAVNPAPTNNAPIEANGERMENAQARYEADAVEEPIEISTGNIGVGGGGGGGG